MSERRIGVRAVIIKDGKVLAQQLINKQGNPYDWWCTPGGGLEPGESLEDGLVREIIEETAITPKVGNLLCIQQFYNEQKQREELEFFFHVTNALDYTHIDLSQTSHGEREIANVAFVDPKAANLLPTFLQAIDLEAITQSEMPTVIKSYL